MGEAKLETLVEICRRFNEHRVKYVVCGAFAGILHGVEKISKQFRPTKDYDFIVDGGRENVRKIKEALETLFSRIEELRDDDLERYETIQIVEEESSLLLDLIVKMWGIEYPDAQKNAIIIEIQSIKIPVLNIDALIKMKKNSLRPQDRFDTYWLTKIKEANK